MRWIERQVVVQIVVLAVAAALASGQEPLALSRYNQRSPDWAAELALIREYFQPDRDQLSAVGLLLSGAMTEQQMQRRLYDRRRNAWENAAETEQTKATAAAENRRFAERRLQIELAWMTELKELVLTDSQRAAWSRYERARRIDDMLHGESDPGLHAPALLCEIELTSEEKAAVADAIQREEAALDDLARKYLAATGHWLSIRWGKTTGDLDRAEQARSEIVARIPEALRAGLRTVCDALPAEKAQALRTSFELREVRSEFGISKTSEIQQFAELLKISTLDDEQRKGLEAVMAAADRELVKAARKYYDARKTIGNDWELQEKLGRQYYVERCKAQSAAYRKARELLSEAQRQAFDDGFEPPIGLDDLRERYEEQDREEDLQAASN